MDSKTQRDNEEKTAEGRSQQAMNNKQDNNLGRKNGGIRGPNDDFKNQNSDVRNINKNADSNEDEDDDQADARGTNDWHDDEGEESEDVQASAKGKPAAKGKKTSEFVGESANPTGQKSHGATGKGANKHHEFTPDGPAAPGAKDKSAPKGTRDENLRAERNQKTNNDKLRDQNNPGAQIQQNNPNRGQNRRG
ncbi:hypothetical protein BH09SUM1_BH09SUM1_25680 [soil metagenome]